MKKILMLVFCLLLSLNANAQVVNIPDRDFLQALIKNDVDVNNDRKIQLSEAKETTGLAILHKQIKNFEGISSFTNLERLAIQGNAMTSLNLSKLQNLKVLFIAGNPNLADLNIKGLTQLEKLTVRGYSDLQMPSSILKNPVPTTKITSLDLSTLSSLKELHCSYGSLTELNLSGLSKLEKVVCDNNKIVTARISKALNLKSVDLSNNPIDTTVDIRGLVFLESFKCEGCKLFFLNFSGTASLKDVKW